MLARTLLVAGSATAILAIAGSAFAQQQPAPGARAEQAKAKLDAKFKAADTNHDGMLSREEAKAGMPNVYKHFDEIDTAKKGAVSEEEIGAYLASKAKQRRAAQPGG